MTHRRLLAGVAVAAAMGAGATIGLFLGVPGLSGAQTAPSPSATTSPTPGKGFAHGGVGFGSGLGLRGGAPLGIVAKDLNMTTADLRTALSALGGGQSIAALARSRNVDPQKIINDLVADATSRIDAAASSGKITAAMATTLKGNLTPAITAFVNGTRPPRPPGALKLPGVTGTVVPRLASRPSLDIVAKDLNMTTADLRTALKGGQSIAALATSKNVDPQKIINDLVADATSRIDAAASSGKITSSMATTLKGNLTPAITAFVNGTPSWSPGGGFLGPGFRGPNGPGGHVFRGPFGGQRPTSTATPATA